MIGSPPPPGRIAASHSARCDVPLAAAAALAVAAPAPRFRFEELCAGPPPLDDPRSYAVAAKAVVPAPDGQWQLQAQVVHWRGETWRGGQTRRMRCSTRRRPRCGPASARPRSSRRRSPPTNPHRMAAVISGPGSRLVAHQYLLADPASSTIASWPCGRYRRSQVPWLPVPDAQVLDALATPLCRAYLGLVWVRRPGQRAAKVEESCVARVVVHVMPKAEILDPQGQAIVGALGRLGYRRHLRCPAGQAFRARGRRQRGRRGTRRDRRIAAGQHVIEDWSVVSSGARVSARVGVITFPGTLDDVDAARAVAAGAPRR